MVKPDDPEIREFIPNGPAAGAIVSASLGVFVTGLLTVLAHASGTIKGLLAWYAPAGPLTGKAGVGVLVWLVAWALLHRVWKEWEVAFSPIWLWSLLLLFLGFLGMFPPVFERF